MAQITIMQKRMDAVAKTEAPLMERMTIMQEKLDAVAAAVAAAAATAIPHTQPDYTTDDNPQQNHKSYKTRGCLTPGC